MDIGTHIQGFYIYGIVPNHYEAEQFRKLGNIGVFNIPFQKISAFVSKKEVIDYKQLGTESLAKLLVDHQTTIESVMNMGFSTILPMRLGTFATNTTDVIKILDKGYDLIINTLQKASNLVEYDIVATWADFGKTITQVASSPKVLELKEKLENSGDAITQADQMAMGLLVKSLVDEKNIKAANTITAAFTAFCTGIKQHQLLNDEMVTNTALLMNQLQAGLLEKTLDKLDESLDGELNFKMVGPLPCYSFYTIEVKEISFDDVEAAKNELGLASSTSEKLIKQAYLEKARLFHPDTNTGDEGSLKFNRINKAYQIMNDYLQSVKPSSREDLFSLSIDSLTDNSFFLKLKE
ncbi:MAG: GvpL/GvpF family gas vesicle protein [Mariniphaga sp.]